MKSNLKEHSLTTILIVILNLFILTGCVIVKKPSPTPVPVYSGWITRISEEQICKLPCWEGITPGKSTINEAVDMLRKNPIYKNVADPVEESGNPKLFVTNWETNQGNGGGLVWSREGEDFISWIVLGFRNQNPIITLNDIITSFGDPDSILVEESRGNVCGAGIFYIAKGMEVRILQNCTNRGIGLTSKSEIYDISLYPLNDPGFPEVKNWLVDTEKYLVDWNGYGIYPISKEYK